MLGTQFSYDEYAQYYNKHFLPLKSFDRQLLAEPTEIVVPQEEPKSAGDDDADNEDLEDVGGMEDNGVLPKTGTIVVPEESVHEERPATTVVPENVLPELPQEDNPVSGQNMVITEENASDKSQTESTTVVVDEKRNSIPVTKSTETKIHEDTPSPKKEDPKGKVVHETKGKQVATPKVHETKAQPPKAEDVEVEEPKVEMSNVEETKTVEYKTEAPKENEKTKEEKKQESYDLDDEYFELDGF